MTVAPSGLLIPSGSFGGQIMLLTGRSNPQCARLSREQVKFLSAITPESAYFVASNYPYRKEFLSPTYSSPNIVLASIRNSLEFLKTKFGETGRSIHSALIPYLQDVPSSVIVTGSCGEALLAEAWPYIDSQIRSRVLVLSLGPVLSRRPAFENGLRIQGKRDKISRFFAGRNIDHYCSCGHLGYYEDDELQEYLAKICVKFLKDVSN